MSPAPSTNFFLEIDVPEKFMSDKESDHIISSKYNRYTLGVSDGIEPSTYELFRSRFIRVMYVFDYFRVYKFYNAFFGSSKDIEDSVTESLVKVSNGWNKSPKTEDARYARIVNIYTGKAKSSAVKIRDWLTSSINDYDISTGQLNPDVEEFVNTGLNELKGSERTVFNSMFDRFVKEYGLDSLVAREMLTEYLTYYIIKSRLMTFTLKQSHGAIRKQTFDTITLITENMESIADKLGFEVRMEDIGSGTLADFVSKYRSEIKTYDEWKEKEAVIDSIQRSRIEERRGDSIVINELPEEIFETLKSCTEPSLN